MVRVFAVAGATALLVGLTAQTQLAGAFDPVGRMTRDLATATSATDGCDPGDACFEDAACSACAYFYGNQTQDCQPSDLDTNTYTPTDISCSDQAEAVCCAVKATEDNADCASNVLWQAVYECEIEECGFTFNEACAVDAGGDDADTDTDAPEGVRDDTAGTGTDAPSSAVTVIDASSATVLAVVTVAAINLYRGLF